MSQSKETVASKRKRGAPDGRLSVHDQAVLTAIKNKECLGMFEGDIKMETKLMAKDVKKALANLELFEFIKKVVNVKNRGKKLFMAVEYEPSNEITGGAWYAGGKLDTELIQALKRACFVVTRKATTLDVIHDTLKRVNHELTKQQASDLLTSMVLSNEVIEVKSTGYGEFHAIPLGTLCYKVGSAVGLDKGPIVGAMASIPCGACPRISVCSPGGMISPSTCVYFKKWLDISF